MPGSKLIGLTLEDPRSQKIFTLAPVVSKILFRTTDFRETPDTKLYLILRCYYSTEEEPRCYLITGNQQTNDNVTKTLL